MFKLIINFSDQSFEFQRLVVIHPNYMSSSCFGGEIQRTKRDSKYFGTCLREPLLFLLRYIADTFHQYSRLSVES